MPLLHGRLAFFIDRAEDLPDTDRVFFNLFSKDVTDPFVTGEIGEVWLFKTRCIENTLKPVWEEKFSIPVCQEGENITINIRDQEKNGSAHVASLSIPCAAVVLGREIEGFFNLDNNGKACGRLKLSVQFFPKDEEDRLSKDVPDAYFPVRKNNRLTLYQDADTPQVPQFDGVLYPDGSPYVPTRCWRDIFNAISNAQKFIYITGWSVFTDTKLLRGDDDPEGMSHVGELLKKKANEGVKVLMMVWNDRTSRSKLVNIAGKMGTHDEDTRQFFDGTNVECVLVARCQSDGVRADQFASTIYSHHQKTIICDAEDEDSGLKRVIAFIGGLDITDGRYDTCEFELFKTINTLHKGDFYSNCVVGATPKTGPRQPWHDNHAKVEGPAALDIKQNFEERWKKQVEGRIMSLMRGASLDKDDFVLDTEVPIPENEGGHWNLQLFRSISSDSCVFDINQAGCLHTKGGRIVENSIMRCMVQQIRNAKNFIYMENQYFLGSAFSWADKSETLAHHIIPMEITVRITEKMRLGEDFKVYILIPMFPEGDPTSIPSQEILHWQFRTIQLMYARIATAIQNNGSDKCPTDYLRFFCLGKQEGLQDVPDELEEPGSGTQPKTIRDTLRHCIYVHSKLTIIDDDYVLIGSANINQRSLGGERDTEIAMGGYQPNHTVEEEGNPRGDIHTYRMALWSAHFGGFDISFLNPSTQKCMDRVNEMTQSYWEQYSRGFPKHCDIHMLPYPINVDADGKVTNLEAPYDCFPDTTANVLGNPSLTIPQKITT